MKNVTFFGFWSGQLPEITELHFRSFLHHHPGLEYELWLDQDAASSIDSPALHWLRGHPRIRIREISLDALIEKHVTGGVPVVQYTRWRRPKKWGRKLHAKGLLGRMDLHSWKHPLFGNVYRHSSPLFEGFEISKTYRADLARCLIPLEHYEHASLYADLDVCFTSNLLDLCLEDGFLCRWETYEFANNAIIFVPDRRLSRSLVRRGVELGSFLPWILFTDENCRSLGITIHPTTWFDPVWNPASVLHADADLFFRPNADPAAVLGAVGAERYRAIHWHNHWRAVPADTSVYAGLLRSVSDPQRAPAPRSDRAPSTG